MVDRLNGDRMQRESTYERLAKIMVMLPATSAELSLATGTSRGRMLSWLRFLRAAGLVSHIGRGGENGAITFGHGDGREWPLSGEPPTERIQTFIKIWRLLTRRQSCADLAQALGLSQRHTGYIIARMHSTGAIRIGGWAMVHQCPTPLYDRLPAPNVPRPQPKTREQSNAEHWQRRRELMRAEGLNLSDRMPAHLRQRPARAETAA
jgi:alkylated DNA nucleotide flippase Atl1